MIGEEFLPLGSIVTLKGGNKKVMICGRLQQDVATGKIYHYSACLWPEGSISTDRFYLFNNEDVDVLFYIGLQAPEEFAFRKVLEEQSAGMSA